MSCEKLLIVGSAMAYKKNKMALLILCFFETIHDINCAMIINLMKNKIIYPDKKREEKLLSNGNGDHTRGGGH